ncbi:winged helix-turn-helix transcriptional regulator [Plantactinospora sp. GCM10030261]|uniref:winged helix-turn-helix transcriptional regulator n=1 Tax=Plantactinospora sp. GCM10030261 TaxID=3273420 RepID=UPI00361B0A53
MSEPISEQRLLAAPMKGCGVERTLQILDGKWTTLVLRELLTGPKRFTQLRAGLGSPSPKTLTDRLRVLEQQGILTRTVHPEVPPRVVYELTGRGESLRVVLLAMLDWGERDAAAGTRRGPVHPEGDRSTG